MRCHRTTTRLAMLSYALFFAAAPAAAQTPPASQPPPAASQGRGITISVFTGGAFGNPPAGLFVPLPAGPTSIAVERPAIRTPLDLDPQSRNGRRQCPPRGAGPIRRLDLPQSDSELGQPRSRHGLGIWRKIGIPLDERRRTRLVRAGRPDRALRMVARPARRRSSNSSNRWSRSSPTSCSGTLPASSRRPPSRPPEVRTPCSSSREASSSRPHDSATPASR